MMAIIRTKKNVAFDGYPRYEDFGKSTDAR